MAGRASLIEDAPPSQAERVHEARNTEMRRALLYPDWTGAREKFVDLRRRALREAAY